MTGLDYYKEFVDKCVDLLHKKYGGCSNARQMREKKRLNEMCESSKYNVFLDTLNDEQLGLLADFLDETHSSAIHDVLAMLEDEMCCEDLRLVKDGIEIPRDPCGTELYYDWICRCEGDEWPEQ